MKIREKKVTSDIKQPLKHVSQTLRTSREVGKQLASSVDEMSPEVLMLIEEHLANIVLEWLQIRRISDLEQISVRDFSVLSKLLLDINFKRTSARDVGSSDRQLEAIKNHLLGKA